MINHKLKISIIEALIDPEARKEKTIWGREVKLLKELGDNKYDDAEFWLTLYPGYTLHSFAFFKTERGMMELEKWWREYKQQKRLDSIPKTNNMGLADSISVPPQPPAESPVVWADSI
jgi:hypothetical protein